jgi:autoinducer 2-degrading protein
MYVLFVSIRILPGTRAAFLAASEDNHRHTRQEPGNLRFDVLAHASDADRFFLYEVYHDEAGFRAHQQTAHYARWRDAVAPLMAEPRSAEKMHSIHPQPWA